MFARKVLYPWTTCQALSRFLTGKPGTIPEFEQELKLTGAREWVEDTRSHTKTRGETFKRQKRMGWWEHLVGSRKK